MLTKQQKKWSIGADVAFYDNFIVIQPEVSTSWKGQPYFWLLSMCEAIRQQRPDTELLLMGFSKGAWWGGLFLAMKPTLFHGAVLLAGYCSPMQLPEEREQEGSEVAMASVAKVSRVHAVLGALDAAAPIHAGVYNRIALGTSQGNACLAAAAED